MNLFSALASFIFIFCSCADHSKNEMAVFRSAVEAFNVSSKNIFENNQFIYESIEEKLMDPATTQSAKIWYPKALVIRELSSELIKYLDGLENELTTGANNNDRVSSLFESKGKGEELYSKLINYKNETLAVDSQINAVFRKNTVSMLGESDGDGNKSKEFTSLYFHNISVIGAQAMLKKLANNVRVMENRFVLFCHNQTHSFRGCGYSEEMPVITQDNYFIKGGTPIEITAGIASYTPMAGLSVSINGRKVASENYGTVFYKLKTSLEPGDHVVPIEMSYYKPDGSKLSITRKIKYTVAE